MEYPLSFLFLEKQVITYVKNIWSFLYKKIVDVENILEYNKTTD